MSYESLPSLEEVEQFNYVREFTDARMEMHIDNELRRLSSDPDSIQRPTTIGLSIPDEDGVYHGSATDEDGNTYGPVDISDIVILRNDRARYEYKAAEVVGRLYGLKALGHDDATAKKMAQAYEWTWYEGDPKWMHWLTIIDDHFAPDETGFDPDVDTDLQAEVFFMIEAQQARNFALYEHLKERAAEYVAEHGDQLDSNQRRTIHHIWLMESNIRGCTGPIQRRIQQQYAHGYDPDTGEGAFDRFPAPFDEFEVYIKKVADDFLDDYDKLFPAQ